VPLQLREAWLGQRDTKLNDVRRWGAAHLSPGTGGRDTLAEPEMSGSSGGEARQGKQEEKWENREKVHCDDP
jgi:hypothetical protein